MPVILFSYGLSTGLNAVWISWLCTVGIESLLMLQVYFFNYFASFIVPLNLKTFLGE